MKPIYRSTYMQQTLTIEKTYPVTTEAAKALVLIDIAASHCQAMIRFPGKTNFERFSFESSVKPLPESDGKAFKILSDKSASQPLRVGNAGEQIEEFRTGADVEGKATNAKALLIHAIFQAISLPQSDTFHADVIFTNPHDAKYGPEICKALKGEHTVVFEPHFEALDQLPKTYRLHFHDVLSDMEGRRAFYLIPSEQLEESILLIDIGSMTNLIYCMGSHGGIVDNQWDAIPHKGVHAIAEQIKQMGLLSKLTPHCASTHDIIDVLFSPSDLEADKATKLSAKIAKEIQPVYAQNFTRLNQVAAKFGDGKRFVVGGGASLPGLAEFLNAQPVGDDPQWAALEGLAIIADKFIAAKRRQGA